MKHEAVGRNINIQNKGSVAIFDDVGYFFHFFPMICTSTVHSQIVQTPRT
jgi:hypothetical protein